MSNLAFWAIIIVWVFQAGISYAGFLVLKGQMAATLKWQETHGRADDNRFLLIIGMFATYVPNEGRDKIMDLITKFTEQ